MAQAQNSQALAYYIQWRGQKNRLNLKSEKLLKKKNTGYASLENLHNLYMFVSSATKRK